MDRIYKLIELAAIRMMPGFKSWMENAMHATVEWGDSEHNVLDGEIFNHQLLRDHIWSSWRGDDHYSPWEHDAQLESMLRLRDLRDGKLRCDVPKRRIDQYPYCCPVWVMAQPKPTGFGPYGDLPF